MSVAPVQSSALSDHSVFASWIDFLFCTVAYFLLPLWRAVLLATIDPIYDATNGIRRRRDSIYIALDLLLSVGAALALWHWLFNGLSLREPLIMIALRTLVVTWWYFEWSFERTANWFHKQMSDAT